MKFYVQLDQLGMKVFPTPPNNNGRERKPRSTFPTFGNSVSIYQVAGYNDKLIWSS